MGEARNDASRRAVSSTCVFSVTSLGYSGPRFGVNALRETIIRGRLLARLCLGVSPGR